MTRPRGRPSQGSGVARDEVLAAALAMLDEGRDLTMRALAARLGVTAMSLYRHVGDHAGLLRALSDLVYAEVLDSAPAEPLAEIRWLLKRYHRAVARHPQLTLAIFATPDAFAGVTRHITDRLTALLAQLTDAPKLWRDILIDHAHGSGLAQATQAHYQQALERLLARLS